MSALVLKYLALASMLADHIGLVFFPGATALRMAGRLAFPIFAFLCAEGTRKTSSKPSYLARLFVCAAVSEIPFNLMCSGSLLYAGSQNVCFTLLLGLAGCCAWSELWEKRGGMLFRICAALAAAACVAAAELLATDYGGAGTALVILFFISGKSRVCASLSLAAFDACLCLPSASVPSGYALSYFFSNIQHFCLLAVPALCLYNGRRGGRAGAGFVRKYYFYIFYPSHMLILALLRQILS